LKEGIAVDRDNQEPLFRLIRVLSKKNGAKAFVSLDEYVEGMEEGQEKIYFVVNQDYNLALKSAFMEPFKNSDVDVLVL